jgi:LEA14-like dessication related protein
MTKSRMTTLMTAVLAAVISFYVRQRVMGASRIQPPTIATQTATVTSLDTDAMKLSLSLTVMNPNARDLPVDNVAVDVEVHGLALGEGFSSGMLKLPQTGVTLAAGKRTSIVVPVTLEWKDGTAFMQLGATQGPAPFTAEGNIELAGPPQIFVPFHVEGTIAHEQVQASQRKLLDGLLHRAGPGPGTVH